MIDIVPCTPNGPNPILGGSYYRATASLQSTTGPINLTASLTALDGRANAWRQHKSKFQLCWPHRNFWVGRTTAESAAAAQKEVDRLLDWAQKNAVRFNTEKSGLVQFPPRYIKAAVGVHMNDILTEPTEHVRWLGVQLDPRLNFKHHVMAWFGEAMKVARYMRHFNSTIRGSAPEELIRVVNTCIVPISTFQAEVWCPGLKRLTRARMATPPITSLCKMTDKAVLMGLQSTLLVLWSTPNVFLHREGEVSPANIILEGSQLQISARI